MEDDEDKPAPPKQSPEELLSAQLAMQEKHILSLLESQFQNNLERVTERISNENVL
jgi:hypothetical protein